MVAQSNHVDLDILSELSRARDRLARCEGAREQADRAVEAARAAARRAHEAQGEARTLVARLEGELSAGRDRRPLLTYADRVTGGQGDKVTDAGAPPRPATGPPGHPVTVSSQGRTPPGAAGPGDTSRVDAALIDRRRVSSNGAGRSLPTGLGEDDDDDAAPGDLDRELSEFVAQAEARRAAARRSEDVRTNGRPEANGHANGTHTAADAIEAARREGVELHAIEMSPPEPEPPSPDPAPEAEEAPHVAPDGTVEGEEIAYVGPALPPIPERDRYPGRLPGETVRAYRERRKAERHAAARPIRASGAQALEEFEAARAVVHDPATTPGPPPIGGAAAPGPLPDPPAAEIPGYRACSAQQYRAADPADRHGTYRAVRTAAYEPDADLRVAESAPDGAPIVPPPPGDAWEGLEGWREATEFEWLCAAPMDRHEFLRLVRVSQAIAPRPPEEWRSEDLDARLRSALGWGGISERLTHAATAPTAAEILEELGECWANAMHIAKHAVGYRVRGGKAPAFWMGPDQARKPTLEGAALVERVRRCLKLAHPSADAVLSHRGSPPAARTGAYASDHTTGRKRRRKEAASVGA